MMLPPLPPVRKRRALRRCLSHNDWRKLGHLYGYIDPQRTWRARIAIGELWRPFYGIFGDLNAALRYMPTARIIRFPERRSEIAMLRAEVAELKRFVRTTPTAGAKAEAMVAVGTGT